jgi:hypothetical protein
MTAKQSRFKEAALLTQETAAAKEEGESQAMLFAMLQEQHYKQIAAMTATNKANMDAMMERMNAMVAQLLVPTCLSSRRTGGTYIRMSHQQ